MGINVGAALGTILVGYLGETDRLGLWLRPRRHRHGRRPRSSSCSARRSCSGAGEAPAPLADATRRSTLYGIGLAAVAVIWAPGPVSGRHPDAADRLRRRAARLRPLRERSSCDKEPRERMFAILFLIALNPLFWGLFEQAGGSLNLYTDRYRRPRRRSGVAVPVDQPDLHHPARADVRRAVECARQARAGAVGPGQVRRWRLLQVGARLPRLRLGRQASVGAGGDDPGHLRLPDLSAAHDRRAVPVAGRPQRDEPARADATWRR